jgi:hypothetical protein
MNKNSLVVCQMTDSISGPTLKAYYDFTRGKQWILKLDPDLGLNAIFSGAMVIPAGKNIVVTGRGSAIIHIFELPDAI